ncbi:hypothetical protein Ddc_11430 [Ditylenchus destructor]|nr:hypothetical protein Ddc_11430 [Ditylenchus destructor]
MRAALNCCKQRKRECLIKPYVFLFVHLLGSSAMQCRRSRKSVVEKAGTHPKQTRTVAFDCGCDPAESSHIRLISQRRLHSLLCTAAIAPVKSPRMTLDGDGSPLGSGEFVATGYSVGEWM